MVSVKAVAEQLAALAALVTCQQPQDQALPL
jgi:hypothetical protein